MKVTITDPAQIVLRNASDDTRRKVWAWIEYLKKWDSDPFIREQSQRVDAGENVYMLVTNSEYRIFFSLEKDSITVLDVARETAIAGSAEASGSDER